MTHRGICIAHTPSEHLVAGIAISLTYSHVRTGDPDTLAFRVQAWLDSPLSDNLRRSLWSEFARRHGVLSFDGSEPEYQSAQEAGTSFVPTAALTLPSEVDVLWCLVGRLLLRCEDDRGWQSFAID